MRAIDESPEKADPATAEGDRSEEDKPAAEDSKPQEPTGEQNEAAGDPARPELEGGATSPPLSPDAETKPEPIPEQQSDMNTTK